MYCARIGPNCTICAAPALPGGPRTATSAPPDTPLAFQFRGSRLAATTSRQGAFAYGSRRHSRRLSERRSETRRLVQHQKDVEVKVFTATIGELRVLPETLEETWQRVHAAWK